MIDDLQRLAAAEAAALQLKLAPEDLSNIAADAAASLDGLVRRGRRQPDQEAQPRCG